MSLYMESSSIIDVAKYKMDMQSSIDAFEKKEPHILACIALLEAAERGEIEVLTANLTNSECQHLDGLHDEDVQETISFFVNVWKSHQARNRQCVYF